MEEGTRITTQKKSKKVVTILLIITGILGLALVAVAIYFYSIKDTSTDTDDTTTLTCGCYFIDPSVTSDCGDPRRAFMFKTSTVSSTQTCKAVCSTSELTISNLNSTTEQDLYQVCQLETITDARCNSMTITDEEGKIVTGEIESTNQLNIEATFDQEYSNYQFTINNEASDPDTITSNKLTIKKTIEDLSSSSAINIIATATTDTGDQIDSPICRRLIEITQPGESSVSNLQVQTATSDSLTKISDVKISVGNMTTVTGVKIHFTFGTEYSELVMTKGFTLDTTEGVLEVIQQDLYNSDNFSSTSSFSELDDHTGTLAITAEVFVDDSSIGSASSSVTFDATTGGDDTDNTDTESSFSVSNTGDLTCVERTSPSNALTLTIITTNKGTTTQSITSITDKLPLGFTYVDGSTKINGVSVADSSYVASSTTGDTEELVFAKTGGWTLSSNQSITIVLETEAGSDALSGDNLNEVVVTPEQIPSDPTTLRTSYTVTVAQDCDNPDESTPSTGIFDSTIAKVVLGLLVISVGWYIYNKPKGRILVEKLVDSELYKSTELGTWKIFKPKKYFEESILRKPVKR